MNHTRVILVNAMTRTKPETYKRHNIKRPVVATRVASVEHKERLERAAVVAGSSNLAEWVRTVIEQAAEETLAAAE